MRRASAASALPASHFMRLNGFYPPRNLSSLQLNSAIDASSCRAILPRLSCESLAINSAFGVAYLACETVESRFEYNPAMGRMGKAGQYSGLGAVYSFDMKSEKLRRLEIRGNPRNMSVVGIDFILKDSRTALVSVINHHPTGARVDLFIHSKDSKSLRFVDSISSSQFFPWINSIALTDTHGSFYVTSGPINIPMEILLPVAYGSIVFYHAPTKSFHVVAKKVNFANGISKSADGRFVYASSMGSGVVNVFKVVNSDAVPGALSLVEKVDVGFYPDNVWADPASGAVYVAGVGNQVLAGLATFGAKEGTLAVSPAFFAKVSNNTGEAIYYGHKFKSEVMFVGTDAMFSMASHVAVDVAARKTLFGSVFPSSRGGAVIVCDGLL
ncbi:hypothetical protein HDU83_004761 [Entophlyctis luteolus]|nr:hypothetical protein HDU83_004761 [Entophlyctis luteolus]